VSDLSTSCKKATCRVVLWALYRAMRSLAKLDSRVRDQVAAWPDGRTFALGAWHDGACLVLEKTPQGLVRRKDVDPHTAYVHIEFKNVHAAFSVLTGMCGIAEAYAQHRFAMKGDIAATMQLVRCMELAEAYLFPRVLSRRILKAVPDKQVSSLRVYAAVVFGI
jgi:hypothetical protein